MPKQSAKKAALIIKIAGIAVSVGLLFFVSEKRYHSSARVDYLNDGFYPETLVIHRGEKVTFINRSKRAIWPASDPHPSHLTYPEFDSKKPILSGKSWTMVFPEVGQWHYHNHLGSNYSQDTGVIVVLEAGQSLHNLIDEKSRSYCLSLDVSERRTCWKSRLSMITKAKGVAEAFKELSTLYGLDREVSNSCNNFTHTIGGAAVEGYVRTKKKTWVPETLNCGGGFYHGFMEVYLSRYKNIPEATKLCESLGHEMGTRGDAAKKACYHGVGHGITEVLGIHLIYDWKRITPDLLLQSAEKCHEYVKEDASHASCLNGVFNSFHIHYADYVASFHDSPSDETDFFWMCKRVSDADGAAFCYENMSSFLSETTDIDVAINTIVAAIPSQYVKQAVSGIIENYIFSQTYQKSYASYMQRCRRLQKYLLTEACISAIVRGFYNNGQPNNEFLSAWEFCKSVDLTDDEKRVCIQEIRTGETR